MHRPYPVQDLLLLPSGPLNEYEAKGVVHRVSQQQHVPLIPQTCRGGACTAPTRCKTPFY